MCFRAPGDGKIVPRCVPGHSPMAKCPRNAFPGVRRWRDCALMRSWPDWQWQYSRAIRSRGLAVARFRPDAFPGVNPWQVFHSMHPESGLGRERGASWQDSHAMHPKRAGFGKICAPCIRKAPQTAVGGYTARISCQEGALFAARAPRIMHSAQILPSAAEQRERSQPRRRPYGRRNGARAASCRAG